MSKELVTPTQETITEQVREVLQWIPTKDQQGNQTGKKAIVLKTDLDKIMKDHGVPTQVVKMGNVIKDMVVNATADIVVGELTKDAEEAKAAGTPIDQIKEMKLSGKVATGSGSVKITAHAYAEHSNPQNPSAGKTPAPLFTVARVAGAHNLRHMQESPYAARMKKVLNLK